MAKAKIFIATPTIGHVHADYCQSLVGAIDLLNSSGIGVAYSILDSTESLALKRDRQAHMFRTMRDATHLLFIDSDMRFDPALPGKLLEFDKDAVGVIYTQRQMNLDSYAAAIREGHPREHALARAHKFMFAAGGNQLLVTGELARVEGLGAGFLMLSRHCIEKLSARAETYMHAGMSIADLFGQIEVANKARLSEDLSFCRRWRQVGGEIYAYIGADVQACGTMRYGVAFLHYLASRTAKVMPHE